MHDIASLRTKVFRLSKAKMAELAGVDVSIVSRWETNNLRPSARAVLRMQDAAEAKGIVLDREWLKAIVEADVKPRPRSSQSERERAA